MSTPTKIILILLLALGFYSVYQYRRTRHFITLGQAEAAKAVRYEQHPRNPTMRILFAGDSTAVGTGASSPEESVAGLFGKKYPTAEIVNVGVNGARMRDLQNQLKQVQGQKFDLVVIHAGGNDIVRFTRLEDMEVDFQSVLKEAKKLSDTVVALHGGNVGTARLFPAGTRWLMAIRTSGTRNIFLRVVKENGVHYVDLWRRGKDDPFFADPDKYYAIDHFHPSSVGYKDWFDHITLVLEKYTYIK